MADITIHIADYEVGAQKPGIKVGAWEGQVHMNCSAIESGYPSLSTSEARALAAVLIAQANEVDTYDI